MAKQKKPKPPQGKPKPAPVSDEVLQSLLRPKSPPPRPPEPRDSATGVYVVAAIIIVCAVLAIWGMAR